MTEIRRNPPNELGYEHTLMYGQYKEDLQTYAKYEARRLRSLEKKRRARLRKDSIRPYKSEWQIKCQGYLSIFWQHTFARLGEDWVFLALLGIISSLLSFIMDYGISICQKTKIWLYRDLTHHVMLQYLAWVAFPLILILFSSGFVHVVAPQAIGSGIPEMKTILRGVVLKEYLTFRTLVSKMIGLTCSLGSGMPLGKEGPFVHVASMVAALLSKIITSFKGIYENESRSTEMLAAACAVGVACSFAAPIGGVLFSIEVTSVFFLVRNYWRGFFAACCGAMAWRLLAVWFHDEETLTALFKTNFPVDFPFDPYELIAFILIGVICGFAGALFVWLHRQIVNFNRNHKAINKFLQKNRFLYPTIVTLVISSLTFPQGLGQFMAAELTTHQSMNELFSNATWSSSNLEVDDSIIVSHWSTPYTSIYVNLVIFIVMSFLMTALAITLPIPAGVFIPIFKMGAAFGRLVGECMAAWFPNGIQIGDKLIKILPGGYAVVGAAALSGAATHTVSTSVIVFELTGQMSHILPVIIAVLVANAISQKLQPSIYDSIIQIKKLPYLPPIISTSSQAHNIYVEDIMVRDVVYIWQGMSYKEMKNILKANKRLNFFPLVESSESMILLGTLQRTELIRLLDRHLGKEARLQEVARRRSESAVQAKTPGSARILSDTNLNNSHRRPSRFEIVPVNNKVASAPPTPPMTPKSILKHSPMTSPYSTITSNFSAQGDSRVRQAFEAIFRKALTLQDAHPTDKASKTPLVRSASLPKRVTLPRERVIDMSPEEQLQWEEEQMELPVDFSRCKIDAAPFQLVEKSSLIKVHSLFSMLGLNHAYVTAIGRLVGVVALKELRQAIEKMHSGGFTRPSLTPVDEHSSSVRQDDEGLTEDEDDGVCSESRSEPPSETESESEDYNEGSKRQSLKMTTPV